MEGKIVKVKEMKPGRAYALLDEKFEETLTKKLTKLEQSRFDTELEARVSAVKLIHSPSDSVIISEGGLLDKPPRMENGKTVFSLCLMKEIGYYVIGPKPDWARSGVSIQNTGKKIWERAATDCFFSVEFKMDPDDEIREVYPFPIAHYDYQNQTIKPLPDPWDWYTVDGNTPYDPKIDHVQVWDETDFKILGVLGLVSFLFIMAGPGGWTLMVTMWVLAALGFYSKHSARRDYVLREREEMGIRGSGFDDEIL